MLLNHEGHIGEGSGENIFVVKDGDLFTPPTGDGCLEGITRNSVMTMARDLGYAVHERSLVRTDLYLADEVFFTGTAAELTPIREVDDRAVGEGRRGPGHEEPAGRLLRGHEGRRPPVRRLADLRERLVDDRYRLPRSVVPNRYDLTLAPDLATATYEGAVEIAVTVVEPVDRVVLNAIELEIDGGTLTADDGRALDVAAVELDEEHQRATLVLPEIAAPGAWTLHARVPRGAERPPPRLLPLDLHRRRDGRDAHDRDHAVRGRGCPAGVPVLGRARPEGGVRDHARRARAT